MRTSKYLIILSILSVCVLTSAVEAQILKPAKWTAKASTKAVTIGEEIDLSFLVDIQKDWYLYSTDFDPDLGPMVTEFIFLPNDSYELKGEIKPIGSKEKYDDLWKGNYTYFIEKAEFRQTIKVLKADLQIKGTYAYQVCTDVDGKCIPFDDEFVFSGFKVEAPAEPEEVSVPEKEEVIADVVPEDLDSGEISSGERSNVVDNNESEKIKADTLQLNNRSERVSLGKIETEKKSLWGMLVIAFLAGLTALATPCIYPMIPLTVSIFTKQAKSKKSGIFKALVYGFSIMFLFVLIGFAVSLIWGFAALNELSTHWVLNVSLFLIFILFALSFFGLFEITLPSSFINQVDRQADRGGYIGIFFMAFTLVVVSFSCTVPIVGATLFAAVNDGELMEPVLAMLSFSLAFAIPFTLFAAFPGWLQNLPNSGGWLNSVKVVLGFLELALALKFLSVADLAYHWNILDRDVFLVLWIVIFSFMGFYLLGKIRLKIDPEINKVNIFRLLLSIIVFSFVLYLIPGLFGAPLKSLAGFLPPVSTLDFNLYESKSVASETSGEYKICEAPKYSNLLELPHGIKGYFDYNQAIACAKEQNKPLFIDFTGHGCVNCREMETNVWANPEILKRLKNDFVVVALYVDDRTKLPESESYVSTYDGKTKKTIGKQNADFQITRFKNNAQPYYVLLDNDEELLVQPFAYDLEVNNFVKFLEQGISNFKKRELTN